MSQEVIVLDHTYAENAKIGFTPNINDENKPLLPLDNKYKNEAVKLAIEKMSEKFNINITYNPQSSDISSAVINLKTEHQHYNDIEVTMEINQNIQKCIRELLTNDGLNYKDYDRSHIFFESSQQGNSLIINWKRT